MNLNKNFIGLNRARRPHNAIFVSFTDPAVPSVCLEAARLNWTRVCLKDSDKEVEEKLKQVRVLLGEPHTFWLLRPLSYSRRFCIISMYLNASQTLEILCSSYFSIKQFSSWMQHKPSKSLSPQKQHLLLEAGNCCSIVHMHDPPSVFQAFILSQTKRFVPRCLRDGPSGPGTRSRPTSTSTLTNSNCCCLSTPTTWWAEETDCVW